MKRPNIVMLMADQFRGDCLSLAGHPDVKTPYLDSLGAKGVYFPNAYSACPSCIPARAALFTGMRQEHHRRVGYEDGVDWDYSPMLAQCLADSGYETICVGKTHVHPPAKRCGFQEMKLHNGYLGYYRNPEISFSEHQLVWDDYIHWLKEKEGIHADITDHGVEGNSWVTHPWMYPEAEHPTNWVTTEAIESLRGRDKDKPFFLMASYVRPHPPFDAPESYFRMYEGRSLREPSVGDWEEGFSLSGDNRIYDSLYGCGDGQMRQDAMAGYYACITHLDHQIGRLLQGLAGEGVLEDTVILFLSDHGEQLFDHGLYRKAWPYQGSIHVPLLVKPGRNVELRIPSGSVNESLVELMDVMPTILSMAGVAVPDTVDGENLLPFMQQERPFNRRWIHGEHSLGMQSNQFLVTDHDKFLWFSQTGEEQYFDLASDPGEQHNRIHDPACRERVEELRKALVKVLEGREEGYSDGKQLIAGKTPVDWLKSPV